LDRSGCLRRRHDYDLYVVHKSCSLILKISKIIPSFFTIKEGSTSHPDPLSSGAREKTALLGARNRYALRLADHQRSSPDCAGWDRLDAGLSIPNLKPYLHGTAKRKD